MVNIQSLTSIHADGPVVTDEFLIYVDYVDLVMLVGSRVLSIHLDI